MSRGLGSLQRRLLDALHHHGREARLDSLAALAAGLIPDLGARLPYGRAPSRACYVAVARAVAALRRRGLVVTETIGTTRGRMEWLRDDGTVRPRWRITNPSKYVVVRVSVDSWEPSNVTEKAPVGDNSDK